MSLMEILTMYFSEITERFWSHAPRISIRLKDGSHVLSGLANEVSNSVTTHMPGVLKKKVSDFYDDEVSLHFIIILDCYAI